ncbi:MAG: 1-acyl-sn-glycerol-3-phosphate acyltransferase [Solirubrobacterales bacterium]|jgi:1-acyl-sn-glycerol-3-phosphate acyltransferase|nr:1-acyl-sn-glycerol-3-phosphate acyltransferase [Solirubrobacterales bacterium]
MADLKPQRYKETRPAEVFQHVHEWSRTHEPTWVYELVRLITTWIALFLYRARAISPDNVPDGPVILAPNHFSNMDHFFSGVHTRRKIRFMAKSQLFGKNPVLGYIFKYGGVFPVRRGHHDEEAFITAKAILARGGCVLMYAEGGRSRTGKLGDAKPGVGRLALETGVPVVPVAIHGSQSVRAWKRLVFPKVTIQYGEPITFDRVEDPTREQQQAAAQTAFDHVKAMYAELDERGRGSVIKSLREGAAAAATPREQAHS